MPVTGDATQNQSYQATATAFPYTAVPAAEIADASDPINQEYLSGKRKGAGIVVEEASGALHIYLATGSAPTDPWQRDAPDGTDAVVEVTPA